MVAYHENINSFKPNNFEDYIDIIYYTKIIPVLYDIFRYFNNESLKSNLNNNQNIINNWRYDEKSNDNQDDNRSSNRIDFSNVDLITHEPNYQYEYEYSFSGIGKGIKFCNNKSICPNKSNKYEADLKMFYLVMDF